MVSGEEKNTSIIDDASRYRNSRYDCLRDRLAPHVVRQSPRGPESSGTRIFERILQRSSCRRAPDITVKEKKSRARSEGVMGEWVGCLCVCSETPDRGQAGRHVVYTPPI